MAKKQRRSYDEDFKRAAVMRIINGEAVVDVGRDLKVGPSNLHMWKNQYKGLMKKTNGKPKKPNVIEVDTEVDDEALSDGPAIPLIHAVNIMQAVGQIFNESTKLIERTSLTRAQVQAFVENVSEHLSVIKV